MLGPPNSGFRRRGPRLRRFAGNLGLLVTATGFALVLAEAAARFLLPFDGYHRVLPLEPHQRTDVQLIGGAHGVYTTNAWGLRGDEPPADWRRFYTVVAIGGSTTQSVFLDDRKTWPYVLQETLRARIPHVWVGNAGLDGHSSRSHVLLMHDVVSRIRPDAVLVLAGVNDMLNSALRYVHVLQPYELRRRPGWLVDHSALVRRLTVAKRHLFGGSPGVAYGLPQRPPPPFTGTDPPAVDVGAMLPTLGEFHDNLRTIVRDGRALGIRVVLLTQPLLYEDTARWRALDGTARWASTRRPRLSAAAVWRLLDVMNRTTLTVCAEEQVDCLDLAAAVPHTEAYFYDWCHFNEAGARLVGETVARFLEDSIVRAVGSGE